MSDSNEHHVLNEDEELMPNPNDNAAESSGGSRRGKRSAAKCIKTAKKIAAGIGLKIEFDVKGQPIGDNAAEFTRFMAQRTRDMIPVSYKKWTLVPKELKYDLYNSIAEQWNIDSKFPHKGKLLTACCNRWRAFKCRLNKQYRVNAKEGGPNPWDVHNISQVEWVELDQYCQTPEFQELSKKAHENAAKKDMHRTLGSGGYLTAEKSWEKGEVVHGATSFISEEVDSRTYRWSREHAKKNLKTNKIVCTNPKVAAVVDKAVPESVEFQAAHQNDILTTSIGTTEHSGRVRGYPDYAGFKNTFGKGTRKSKGYSKEEIDQRVQEEVSRCLQEEVQKEVARQMEQNFSRMWPQGQPVMQQYDPITNQAFIMLSQGSNNQPHPIPFPSIQDSMEVLLTLPANNCVVMYVARAVVFARTSKSETVHGEPLGPDEVRVQVLEVFDHAKEVSPPFPPPNADDRLGMLQNSFLRWPSHLVDFDMQKLRHLRQQPQRPQSLAKSPAKKKARQQEEEEEEEVDEDFDPAAFLLDEEFKMRDPLCTPEELERLGPNAAELHNYMMMLDPSVTSFEIKAKFEGSPLDNFVLTFSDINDLFKREKLVLQVMKVWTM
ncbi:hypothetical protein LUZ61_015238 [Rhynchospora tenuis]|uniref:DUF8039 domain-containing protein n=1 Tax=Rhynchospora tenuis TaxID=198213 RepID=A0AAD5WCT0_9POAL|nr:hypothetical protein LUZ61_015238 [Rhynchospora tenuis]